MAGRPEEASNPNAADRERGVHTKFDREAPTEVERAASAPLERDAPTDSDHDPSTYLDRGASTHGGRESTSDADPDATTGPDRDATADYDPDATDGFVHSPGVAAANTEEASRSTGGRKDRELPRITGYEILGVLGAGGMGIVYKARHLRLDRLVALKMIRAGAGARPDDLARFEAEARAVAAIDHPNIIKIFEIGEHDGLPYFSLEFLEGGSLAERIAGKPQPIEDAAQIVETLARAMDVAHRRGIVHRDIKPANVLLAGDGTPKIADFGLVKRLEADSGQTGTGSILGSPSYMAPEQTTGAEKAGPAADQYALGRHSLRDAHRPAAVPRVVDHRHPRPDPHRRARCSVAAPAPHAPRPRDDLPEGAAKRSRPALPRRRGDGRRPPPLPRRRADRGPARLRPRAGMAMVPAQPGSGAFARRGGGLALARHGQHVVLRDPGQRPRARRTRKCPHCTRGKSAERPPLVRRRKHPCPERLGTGRDRFSRKTARRPRAALTRCAGPAKLRVVPPASASAGSR